MLPPPKPILKYKYITTRNLDFIICLNKSWSKIKIKVEFVINLDD